ncbi:MAG: DUF1015 domain-containing protein [Gammaproteobacteria bacterium]|nr:DUF1015 domain-containing protein [Gammaproteobacteria bacterium]
MPTLIKPLRGLRPAAGRAADIIAPPYDVLNSAEARQRAAGKPASFLHVSKAEIDLPEGIDVHDPQVYARAAENFRAMVADGLLVRDPTPCYYVYRLRMGDHVQTGLVCAGSVAAYDANRIRKHEYTRPDKEDDRVCQITALHAQTGPVLLAYRASTAVRDILAAVTAGKAPLYEVTADDGIGHVLWLVDDAATIGRLTGLFEAMDALYIADGHHRSAAASRVAAGLRAADPAAGNDAPYEHFLCVAFPHDEMKILDYNRVVRDLNGHGTESFLAAIGKRFEIEPSAGRLRPARPAEFGMYLGGRWHRLRIRRELVPADPVASLDVSLLQDNLLAPLLGITDPRTDRRIDFVGGMRGLGELEKRVGSGEMAVAFALYPTSMSALMAVADANQVMPPKSTWFEPKLADGLVSHGLD